jgi:hypothetical protein
VKMDDVGVIKSLWASVQGSPKFMMHLNGYLTLAWLAMIPISIVTGWIESIVFVSAVSIYANMTGHWSAWQASRVEVKQEEMDEKADEATVHAVKEEVREVNRELRDETN